MEAFNKQRIYYLRGDANALGGHLEKPIERTIPTLAPVSLPAVGGFSAARSGAFNLEEIVSFSAAYTRVSGRENAADGSSSILVTSVVEDLNILEVVRAERIAMQLSISIPGEPGQAIHISTAGSAFEGLQLAGQECRLKLNPILQRPESADGLVTWQDAWRVGHGQAETLLAGLKGRQDGTTYQWASKMQQGMAGNPPLWGAARCSLIDSLETSGASRCSAHVVEIPEFGRIILGQLLISPDFVQLQGIRVDLSCSVCGQISGIQADGGGYPDCKPPHG